MAANGGFGGFPKQTLQFLKKLDKNNNKKWFDAHREDYEAYYLEPAKAFVEALDASVKKISKGIKVQPKVNGSIRRINRDVRFSKDKRPYKNHLDIILRETNKKGCGSGLFLRILPSEVGVGVGMHEFPKDVLTRYRKAVAGKRGDALSKIVGKVRKAGFDVGGEHYKRVPRGFDPDHEHEALLRFAGLYTFVAEKPPAALHSKKFIDYCVKRWQKGAELHRWLLKV